MYEYTYLTDYKILLKRNGLWNDSIESYLTEVLKQCTACRYTYVTQSNRKVSISAPSKRFNELLYVDHLYLDGAPLVNFIDLVTRHSSAMNAKTANLEDAFTAFEADRVTHFWYHDTVLANKAFQMGFFKE